MSEYIELLEQAISIIKMRYEARLNEIHAVGEYGVKPMFAEKYSIAYTACLDDIADGVSPIIVNASVYHNGQLDNIDFSYEQFLTLYRAVKDLYRPIEKKYQEYLAEFSNNPTLERLNYIIEHDIF